MNDRRSLCSKSWRLFCYCNICIVPSRRRVPNGIHFDSWGRTCSVRDWSNSNISKLIGRMFWQWRKESVLQLFLWLSMSSLCQSIYCRTSCPFCLQVRSLKQKRLRRRANKSRKEKIPARRSPGALIRHSKNNFSKKRTTFLWQYLTCTWHIWSILNRPGFVWSSADLSWDPSRGPVAALATTCSGHQLPQGHSLREMHEGYVGWIWMVILLVEFLLLISFRLVYDIKIMLCVVFLQHIRAYINFLHV